ncbi:hypothetical protein, partial [uncultured Anaerococcus sp.]|uniref:hypothetical protein n=1 Tax=uncultured Anaerococcus sp. TaxID=293428 RepID=UPI002889C62D
MKKRFTLLIAMVMLLTAMATNVFASSANNNSEVSPKEWQEWFNGLSKEEQLSVNYELAQSQQALRLSDEDIEWLNWYNSLSKEEQLAVNYVPSQVLKVFSANEVSKVNIDDLKLKEETKETIGLRSTKMPTGGYEFKYDPSYWNEKKEYANCYAYALNVVSRTRGHKLQPGEISGRIFESLSCRDIIDAAYRDMPKLDYKLRRSSYSERPGYREYKVALVVGRYDYHW